MLRSVGDRVLASTAPQIGGGSDAGQHIPRVSEATARARLLPARYPYAGWISAGHPGLGGHRRRAPLDQHSAGPPEGAKRAPRSARRSQRGGPRERVAHRHGPRTSGGGHYRGRRSADRPTGEEVPERRCLSVPTARGGARHPEGLARENKRDRARGTGLSRKSEAAPERGVCLPLEWAACRKLHYVTKGFSQTSYS